MLPKLEVVIPLYIKQYWTMFESEFIKLQTKQNSAISLGFGNLYYNNLLLTLNF